MSKGGLRVTILLYPLCSNLYKLILCQPRVLKGRLIEFFSTAMRPYEYFYSSTTGLDEVTVLARKIQPDERVCILVLPAERSTRIVVYGLGNCSIRGTCI